MQRAWIDENGPVVLFETAFVGMSAEDEVKAAGALRTFEPGFVSVKDRDLFVIELELQWAVGPIEADIAEVCLPAG